MAYDALRLLGFEPAAKVCLQSVIEEECTGNGALACLVHGYHADAAIIPEPLPTSWSGSSGVMWVDARGVGRAGARQLAHTGTNAIDCRAQPVRRAEASSSASGTRRPAGIGCGAGTSTRSTSTSAAWKAASGPRRCATTCRADMRLWFYPGHEHRAGARRRSRPRLAEAHARPPAARQACRTTSCTAGSRPKAACSTRPSRWSPTLAQCHRDVVGPRGGLRGQHRHHRRALLQPVRHRSRPPATGRAGAASTASTSGCRSTA